MFVVRKGNPKAIKDWPDLAKAGVSVVTPNPKTSGGARWNYLAAWAYELDRSRNDQAAARKFVEAIYRNVPVLDSGARGSTTTFAQRGVGDVLVAWENEAFLALQEFGADKFEIVVPPSRSWPSRRCRWSTRWSTSAAPARWPRPISISSTRRLARRSLPRTSTGRVKPDSADPADLARFPKIKLVTVDQAFGGWAKAQAEHFAEGGIFDQIYKPGGRPATR